MRKYLWTLFVIICFVDIHPVQENERNRNLQRCGWASAVFKCGSKAGKAAGKASKTQKAAQAARAARTAKTSRMMENGIRGARGLEAGQNLARQSHILELNKLLCHNLDGVRTTNDIKPRIAEYLRTTYKGENGVKIIRCCRKDAKTVRMTLTNASSTRIPYVPLNYSREIRPAINAMKVIEYEISAMREVSRIVDGVECIEFIIPRKARYINAELEAEFHDRVWESAVIQIPKDGVDDWNKLKEFIRDFFTRPDQVLDEIAFKRELKAQNLVMRDIVEISEIKFAKTNIEHETINPVQEEAV